MYIANFCVRVDSNLCKQPVVTLPQMSNRIREYFRFLWSFSDIVDSLVWAGCVFVIGGALGLG